jgi:hypothetical protein
MLTSWPLGWTGPTQRRHIRHCFAAVSFLLHTNHCRYKRTRGHQTLSLIFWTILWHTTVQLTWVDSTPGQALGFLEVGTPRQEPPWPPLLTLWLTAFWKCVTSWPVAELPTNLWANLPTAVRDGLFKEKLGRAPGAARGGGKAAIATAPSH